MKALCPFKGYVGYFGDLVPNNGKSNRREHGNEKGTSAFVELC